MSLGSQVGYILHSFDTSKTSFLTPLLNYKENGKTESQETLVAMSAVNLLDLPTEIITQIAMCSGFIGALTMRNTCSKLRKILSDKRNWREYGYFSDDIVESKATISTKLNQFDQIVFSEWRLNGKIVPCVFHRTFLENYDIGGIISFEMKENGLIKASFQEDRRNLLCYKTSGSLVDHTCQECAHYDHRTVMKSAFVYELNQACKSIEHLYKINSKCHLLVEIIENDGIFGYRCEEPCVTSTICKLNGVELSKLHSNLFLKYLR
jgi:hypothetical protein